MKNYSKILALRVRFTPDTTSHLERLQFSTKSHFVNLDDLQKNCKALFKKKIDDYLLDQEKFESVKNYIIEAIPDLYSPESDLNYGTIDRESQHITQILILSEYNITYKLFIKNIENFISLELKNYAINDEGINAKILKTIADSIRKTFYKKFKKDFFEKFQDLEFFVAPALSKALQPTQKFNTLYPRE